MYFFLFGVILPAVVTLALFIGFLICWFKCDVREKFHNRRRARRERRMRAQGRTAVEGAPPGNLNPADIHVNKIANGKGPQVKVPLDSNLGLQRQTSVGSVHLYETLDSLDIARDSRFYDTMTTRHEPIRLRPQLPPDRLAYGNPAEANVHAPHWTFTVTPPLQGDLTQSQDGNHLNHTFVNTSLVDSGTVHESTRTTGLV